jgi:hypothetical protein
MATSLQSPERLKASDPDLDRGRLQDQLDQSHRKPGNSTPDRFPKQLTSGAGRSRTRTASKCAGYSVPYQLVHEEVDVRSTSTIVEIYYKARRLDSHPRRYDHQPSTKAEHMPSSHRAHAEWTPSRLIHWAEKTGPATGRLVAGIQKSRPHPEQGYRACLGLMRLGGRYGVERLEAASARAEHLRSYSYQTVKNILASAQDRLPFEDDSTPEPTASDINIRGALYYAEEDEC